MINTIVTRFRGPTACRGARISARAYGVRIFVPYPYELSGMDCHIRAAEALAAQLGWGGDMLSAPLYDGSYVHIMAQEGES